MYKKCIKMNNFVKKSTSLSDHFHITDLEKKDKKDKKDKIEKKIENMAEKEVDKVVNEMKVEMEKEVVKKIRKEKKRSAQKRHNKKFRLKKYKDMFIIDSEKVNDNKLFMLLPPKRENLELCWGKEKQNYSIDIKEMEKKTHKKYEELAQGLDLNMFSKYWEHMICKQKNTTINKEKSKISLCKFAILNNYDDLVHEKEKELCSRYIDKKTMEVLGEAFTYSSSEDDSEESSSNTKELQVESNFSKEKNKMTNTRDHKSINEGNNNDLNTYIQYDTYDNYEHEIPCIRASHSGTLIGDKIFIFGGWDGIAAINNLYVYEIEQKRWHSVDYKVAEDFFEKIKCLRKHYPFKKKKKTMNELFFPDKEQLYLTDSCTSESSKEESAISSRIADLSNASDEYDDNFNSSGVFADEEKTCADIRSNEVEDYYNTYNTNYNNACNINSNKFFHNNDDATLHKPSQKTVKSGTCSDNNGYINKEKPNEEKKETFTKPKGAYQYYRYFKRTYNHYNFLQSLDEYEMSSNFTCPSPRNNHAACSVGEKIYIYGGHDTVQWLDDFYVLNVKGVMCNMKDLFYITKDERKREKEGQSKRKNKKKKHSSDYSLHDLKDNNGSSDSSDSSSSYILNDAYNFATSVSSPSYKKDHAQKNAYNCLYFVEIKKNERKYWPTKRACHTLNAINNKIYLFGGYDGSNCPANIDVFDVSTKRWTSPETSGSLPEGRSTHAMTEYNEFLFLYGGRSATKVLRDFYSFNTETFVWTEIKFKNYIFPALAGHSLCFFFKKLFIFGGYNGKIRLNHTFILDMKKKKIHKIKGTHNTPNARQRHSCCIYRKKKIFIFGGFDGLNCRNDLHIFDGTKLELHVLNDYSSKDIARGLYGLINNPKYSDVTFLIKKKKNEKEKKIYAHKNILSSISLHFRYIFSNYKVYKQNHIYLVITHWSYKPFLKMIEFLYTGKIKDIQDNSNKTLVELLGISDEYSIDSLKKLCISILINKINVSNVCFLIKYANLYRAYELKYYCMLHFKNNYGRVIFTKGINELKCSPTLMKEIMTFIITPL